MPNWNQVLLEIQEEHKNGNASPLDFVRRKYLSKIYEKTGRNIIAYYSGWLQNPTSADAAINDKDKSAFMTNIHGLDRSKGLDLILHTPGGRVSKVSRKVLSFFDKL